MQIYTIVGQDQSCWVYWKIKALEFHIPPRENKGIFSWYHKMTAENCRRQDSGHVKNEFELTTDLKALHSQVA